MEKARLKSVFKKVRKLNEVVINRFPYSVFQVKYLKGLISKNLDDHIESNDALTANQWDFRKGRSTKGLLLHMTETWKQALDKGLNCGRF